MCVGPALEYLGAKICDVRTYHHTVFTWTVARSARRSEPGVVAWSVAGAVLPGLLLSPGRPGSARDGGGGLPAASSVRSRARSGPFGAPGAAAHSAVPVRRPGNVLSGVRREGVEPTLEIEAAGAPSGVGHVLPDVLTHAGGMRARCSGPLRAPF